MNCEQYREWFGDAVDGALDAERRAHLEAHLRGCRGCRELLGDLAEIRAAAATLDRRTPSPDVWNAIEAAVEPRSRQSRSWAPLAAAATVAAMLGSAVWFDLGPGTGSIDQQQAEELVRSAASELQLAEQHYENAIATLEKLTADRASLDPVVADAIAESLQSIDTAIEDSRTALRSDPDSFVAQTSLLEALRTKVALLQETVTLLNARS